MSKLNIKIVAIVLATVLSAGGYAFAKGGGGGHGGGGHGGGGHGARGGGHGGGHFARGGGRHFGGGGRHVARQSAIRSSARPNFSGNRPFAVQRMGVGGRNPLYSRALARTLGRS